MPANAPVVADHGGRLPDGAADRSDVHDPEHAALPRLTERRLFTQACLPELTGRLHDIRRRCRPTVSLPIQGKGILPDTVRPVTPHATHRPYSCHKMQIAGIVSIQKKGYRVLHSRFNRPLRELRGVN